MTLTLVTGGVRSGKSRYAEALLRTAPVVRYVAPLVDAGDDPEWVRRVQAHRLRRPAGWVTVEGPVLVDCLGTWVTALVDRAQAWADPAAAESVVGAEVTALLQACTGIPHDVVLVTNEVGWGVVPEYASGRLFRDLLGTVNARASAAADRVVLVVAGRALELGPALALPEEDPA